MTSAVESTFLSSSSFILKINICAYIYVVLIEIATAFLSTFLIQKLLLPAWNGQIRHNSGTFTTCDVQQNRMERTYICIGITTVERNWDAAYAFGQTFTLSRMFIYDK